MNKLQKHFEHERTQLRMTEAEKRAMRTRLMSAVETPEGFSPSRVQVASPYQWMFAPRSVAMLAAAFLLVVTSGTAYAAQGSLPGGPLYPVKVKVIEPITVALATTPTAKAQANAAIATTRVQEAQTLAAQGTLTPQVAQEISDNYNVHARAALALVDDSDTSDVTTESSATPELINGTTVLTSQIDSTTGEVDGKVLIAPGVINADIDTTDHGRANDDDMRPADAVPPVHMQTMVVTLSSASSSGSALATGTVRTYGYSNSKTPTYSNKVQVTISAATKATTTAATTTAAASLAQELHTSLSVQAKILDQLNAEVQMRSHKGSH